MPRFVPMFDPNVVERRINLVIQEGSCPGLLEFLSSMPYRTETPLVRGILYQWFVMHRDAGTLDDAIDAALEGAGGLLTAATATPTSKRQGPGRPRNPTVRTPRAISARPVARSKPSSTEVIANAAAAGPDLGEPTDVPAVPRQDTTAGPATHRHAAEAAPAQVAAAQAPIQSPSGEAADNRGDTPAATNNSPAAAPVEAQQSTTDASSPGKTQPAFDPQVMSIMGSLDDSF